MYGVKLVESKYQSLCLGRSSFVHMSSARDKIYEPMKCENIIFLLRIAETPLKTYAEIMIEGLRLIRRLWVLLYVCDIVRRCT